MHIFLCDIFLLIVLQNFHRAIIASVISERLATYNSQCYILRSAAPGLPNSNFNNSYAKQSYTEVSFKLLYYRFYIQDTVC